MKLRFSLTAWILILLTAAILPLNADEGNNSVAAFIRMGIGSRIIAMGETGSTVCRDVVSGYWNPAGLVALKDYEVSTMYNFSMGYDRSHKYAAVGTNLPFGALAFSWVNAGVGDIDGHDENGDPTGSFSDNEHNFALSYANSFKRLSYGITPKLYLSSIAGESDAGFGLDLGVKYDINQYLEAGVMARDLYGRLGDLTIPYEMSAGLAAYPLSGVTVAADFKLEQNLDPYVCFGIEYWTSIGRDPEAGSQLGEDAGSEESSWNDLLSDFQTGLRLGYNQGRFSFGTGLSFSNFQLDYAFRLSNHEIFSDDHILSLMLRF